MADLNIGLSAPATGTADVITATYSPAITLSDRRIVFLTGCVANLTTTPTFNPNGLGAQVIKGKGGVALKAGEILGDCILIYHTTGTYWELLASQLTRSTLAQILANGALTGGTAITGNSGEHKLTLNDSDARLHSVSGDIYGVVRTDGDLATMTAGDDNTTSSTVTVSSVQAHVTSDNLVNLDAPSVRLTQQTASRVAILDASKDIVGADTATYPSLTELSYVKLVTSPIQTQLNNKSKASYHLSWTNLAAPVDGATYLPTTFVDLAAQTSSSDATRIKLSTACSSFLFNLNYLRTTAGNSENITVRLVNVTQATNVDITTTLDLSLASSGSFYWTVSLSCAVNDLVEIQFICPTWPTSNPSNWRVGCHLIPLV